MSTKNSKRILEVKIKHLVDESPDTSWLGEYSNKPTSDYSIDRASDTFQGGIDAGQDWLDRIESWLDDMIDSGHVPEWDSAFHEALNTIEGLKDDEPFDVSWDAREYRYFNPSFNYIKASGALEDGNTPDEVRKYVRQDYERMESLNAGNWYFMGIRADAAVQLMDGGPNQHVISGGLWGIESDGGREYLEETESEQLAELKQQLTALGFSKRAIAMAFKDVKRSEV